MNILNEIINESCGKNAQDKPKSALTFDCSMWPVNANELSQPEPRMVGTRSAYKPVIEIEKHGEFIQVDLIFQSYLDADLKIIWNLFEKYGDLLNEISDESTEVPAATLTITPVIYDGKYYILCISPLFWTLQPEKPGGQANVIRILFHEDDFGVFESEGVDIDAIDREIERDVANEEATYAHIAAKENEYAQELSNRADRLEKIRDSQYEENQNEDENFENEEEKSSNTGNSRFRII